VDQRPQRGGHSEGVIGTCLKVLDRFRNGTLGQLLESGDVPHVSSRRAEKPLVSPKMTITGEVGTAT
jgi:hypothetical protein